MSSPTLTAASPPHPRHLTLALFVTVLLTLPARARGPEPPQRIPLEPFGFQTISPRYLLEGATMVTVDYVDAQHLLVTFGVSRLMPRLAECPSDDEDRTVRAVLLELPSGRELARTEWRFHDLGQYLWSLGDGRFLLRRRDALAIFSPLDSLPSGNAFAEQPFLHFDRRIEAILVSANHDLLSIETVKRPLPKPPVIAQATSQAIPQTVAQTTSPPIQPGSSQNQPQNQPQSQSTILSKGLQRRGPNEPQSESKPDPTPIQIDFIRLLNPDTSDEQPSPSAPAAAKPDGHPRRLLARVDGRIYTSTAVNIPLTTEGFLRTKATSRDGVLLDFLTFSGKDIDLGDFATSCHPRPSFVSRSEFVAFGCRGSEGQLDLAGFNLRGDFLWQINFDDEQAYPAFASAVPSGRFAFSRTVTSTHVFGNETPSMDQLQAQEVRVIQMYNGKQLLKVVTSPIQRAGQNFTLSPDGLSLAVIHDNPIAKGDLVTHQTSIEIYKLPALSSKDLAQIKLEAALAPEPLPADANVHMRFSPEEIKAALAAKPAATAAIEASAPSPQADPKALTPADSRIAGDHIPQGSRELSTENAAPLTPAASGTIPSSDPAPACATLKDTASIPNACPTAPSPNAAATPNPAAVSPADPAADPDAQPEKRRKPPTLYEPAPAAPAPQ